MDFDAPELGLGPQLVTGEGSTAYIGMLPPKKGKGLELGMVGLVGSLSTYRFSSVYGHKKLITLHLIHFLKIPCLYLVHLYIFLILNFGCETWHPEENKKGGYKDEHENMKRD